MAVIVKDFSWTQTSEQVVVRVPLRGVHPSKVDLLTHDAYIKASFRPFIFEAFLFRAIKESSSKAIIVDGEVLFNLEKEDKNFHWDSLCADLTKEERGRIRENALREIQQLLQSQSSKKQELLQNLQRKSVQQQIQLETQEKAHITELKNTERENAMLELEAWKTGTIPTEEKPCVTQECTESSSVSSVKKHTEGEKKIEIETSSPGDKSESIWRNCEGEVHRARVQLNKEDLIPVPFTRKSGSIKVKFTPRAFPTPQRESKNEEEQEWLRKQAEARRATGFVVEDLRPEECNPDWLKDKGDAFFKMGNYLGAVSAYSHGIKLCDKMASLYVNRSAAHLALDNLRRVIEDTSMALELMVPKVKLNEVSRARCHARRGAALCKLGMLDSGLKDLELAFQLQPHDEKLLKDIERVKSKIESHGELNDE